ncbi:LysR family transcriptional regulator [Shimia sp.]|uniref:LysR family transcriptional regulator n=1 Tax=Shimia sp. TaxID=1954381 RepID=UPI0032984E24
MTTVRQFGHFLAVLEHGSFIAAAREVNISQPAISKSIATLEAAYGAQFFVREPGGVKPTALAMEMEHHARRILLDYEQSRREIAAIANGTVGRLRVGTGMDLISCTEQAMSALSIQKPGVDFTVVTDHAEQLRSALLGNHIDLYAGMVNRLIHEEAFDVKLFASDRIVGLCHVDHEFAGNTVAMQDLQRHDWIKPVKQEAARIALESFFYLKQQPLPRFRFVTNAPTIIGRRVKEQGCLSTAPKSSIEEFEQSEFSAFHMEGFEFARKIGIARRAHCNFTLVGTIYRAVSSRNHRRVPLAQLIQKQ